MGQEVRWRKQQPVTYVSGAKQVIQLSRGMIYREMYLNLTCTPTLSAANNTIANAAKGDQWGVVKRIDIVANASDIIRSFTGEQLWFLNRFYYGFNPRVFSILGDGATANPVLDSTLIIPFWSPRSAKPMDTCLDSRELSDLRLEITWGTFTDVNSAATAWTTNPQIVVGSLEAFGIDGPFNLARVTQVQVTPAGANTGLRVDLPVGPQYRGLLINTTTGGNDTTGLVTNVKLISGTTVFYDQSEGMIRDTFHLRNDLLFPFTRPTAAGIGFIPRALNSPANNQDAWYGIELVTDGYTTEAIDTYGFSEFYLELALSAAATVNILPLTIIPRRDKQGNVAA
jgi:hypothetical protein